MCVRLAVWLLVLCVWPLRGQGREAVAALSVPGTWCGPTLVTSAFNYMI
jgi:hypothetical protein